MNMPMENTAALSLPKTRTVRGCTIRRLALGGYLQAIGTLQGFPSELLAACFPGEDLYGILDKLKRFDAGLLQTILAGALAAVPGHLVRLAAGLTGIEEEKLLNDPGIGPVGLAEILTAWVEVNGLDGFMPAVRGLAKGMRTAPGSSRKPGTGSSA